MGADEPQEPGDLVEKISQDQVLRRLLRDRFDCNNCADFKHRGSGSISHCLQHLEQLKEEMVGPEKKQGK